MASSTGSSPVCRLLRPRAGWLGLAAVLAAAICPAAMPDYVREALGKFSTEVPAGWAYTLTTARNAELRTTARFDPAKPPAERWTLLELNGRTPTAKEAAQYAQAATGGNASTPQGAFQKSDIEPGSVELVREDADRGEFRCSFRAAATGADKMLGHLGLRLIISKRQPHVEKSALELTAPYSPILGVQMRELLVQMSFTAPGPDRPSLPLAQSSHFLGRIFFIGTEENLEFTYTDFVRAP
ncbi:hypothetical protein SAMN05444173_3207 [Opitutus sp. GAS368]|jgi:hypothetical protein|nr:hypothetical protein SAMN05444173_3207 [Opitutus sp. GAS368]